MLYKGGYDSNSYAASYRGREKRGKETTYTCAGLSAR